MTPYFERDGVTAVLPTTCGCGCGAEISGKTTHGKTRRFVSGHNLKGLKKTKEHCEKISAAQTRSWRNPNRKTQRRPKGSRRINHDGYIEIKTDDGNRWEREHIVLIETIIGRRLFRGEEVHHINGVRDDNRLDNLYLCATRSDHNKVEWSAKKLLKSLLESGAVIFDKKAGEYRLP